MARGKQGTGVQPLKTCIRLRFTQHGKRRTETLELAPTTANIKAAERMMVKIRREIDLGVFDYAATFPKVGETEGAGDFLEKAKEWLKTLSVEKSTYEGYERALLRVWAPAFAGKHLEALKAKDIREVVAARAEIVSGKTINNDLIPLRRMLADAVVDEDITETPARTIRNRKHQSPPPDPFTAKEMEAVLGHMAEAYDAQVVNYFTFAFGTGLRPSEQIIVPWRNVDWQQRTIRIDRSFVRGVEKNTKVNLVRFVDLTDRMIGVLRRQKQHTFMLGANAAIFHNPQTGRRWSNVHQQRRVYFHPTLRALGIRIRDAYQTRHTFATMGLMGGVNAAYMANQMGHTSTAMFFKRYAKWINGEDDGREAAKMNALFGQQLDMRKAK